MTDKEKVQEWVRFYKQSPLKYNMNALIAVLRSDPALLPVVLKELGLSKSEDLVRDAAKNYRD